MHGLTSYEKIEKRYSNGNYNRKCIDGQITSCSNCVGYCMYQEHKGFLTREQRKEHNCIGKQCHHYIAKPKYKEPSENKTSAFIESLNSIVEKAFTMACSLTKEYEAMRFMKADLSDELTCELSYISISNDYEYTPILEKIQKMTGLTVSMKQLNYSFENTIELIMAK